jgi:hypothetical protein
MYTASAGPLILNSLFLKRNDGTLMVRNAPHREPTYRLAIYLKPQKATDYRGPLIAERLYRYNT